MTKTHTPEHKHHHKTIWLSLACVVGLIVICGILAYGTNFHDPVSRTIKRAFPAAVVGGRMVSIQSWDDYHNIAKRLNPAGATEDNGQVLIKQLRQHSLLTSLRITITPQDLDDELAFLKSDEAEEYDRIVDEYFDGSNDLFQERVIVPRVYDKLLRVYHNTDPNSRKQEHIQANALLERIKQGEGFEEVVSESDDQISAQLGGDLGFVRASDVLPEIGRKLSSFPVGEVHQELIISRLGYHIIYVEETAEENGEKLYHLKHILISADGFEEWQDVQLNKIKVWQIRG